MKERNIQYTEYTPHIRLTVIYSAGYAPITEDYSAGYAPITEDLNW